MREVRVLVRVQVDECDPDAKIDPEIMQEAAVEAVENAVRFAYDNGFSHAWTDDLSIRFVDAVLYEEDEDDSGRIRRPVRNSARAAYELEDGGVIEYPDDAGTIRRRDQYGNVRRSARAHRRQLCGEWRAVVRRAYLTFGRRTGRTATWQ